MWAGHFRDIGFGHAHRVGAVPIKSNIYNIAFSFARPYSLPMLKVTDPIWSDGLRPFYLLGAIDGCLAMLAWTLALSGHGAMSVFTHASGLIGGLLLAIVTGFLLTAVPNWTGRPLVSPTGLRALTLLWLAGRATFWLAGLPVISLTIFPAVVAALIVHRFVVTTSWRHWAIAIALITLPLAALLSHSGAFSDRSHHGWYLALAAIAVLVTVIGGRIIPAFTNNAVAGADARQLSWLDLGTVLATIVALAAWAFGVRENLGSALAMVALGFQAIRFLLWRPWKTRTKLLLWILPLSYLWLIASLAMIALGLPGVLALHAMAAGAMGGMMLAVMTRSSKGHTGRALEADGWDGTIYGLVHLGAALRVAAAFGFFLPDSLLFSGASWTAAFGLFAVRYWLVLTQPRLDRGAPHP
jgi:uncharacterized protein involved in response to NO